MANKVSEDIGFAYIPEDLQMYGRRYVNELYSPYQGYDRMQFSYWYAYLTEIALSAFEWENVPAGIDTRAIEYILLHWGLGAIFTEDDGHLFAQAASSNMLNMYYNPNEVVLTAPNGQMWERHAMTWVLDTNLGREVMPADCVVCFDNMMRQPLMPYVKWYAKRLAMYDRTADVNICAQKTPYIVASPEESKRTRQDIIKKLASNEQYIEVNSELGINDIVQVLPTTAPFVADKIFECKKKILNEAMTLLGCDNTNDDKRERMVVDEVLSNNEQIALLRRSRLECRTRFAEAANAMFGLDIKVKWGVPHLKEPSADAGASGSGELFGQPEQSEVMPDA